MVVLADLGIDVSIQNNDVVWVPTWEYNGQFDADIMVIDEHVATYPNNNFTVTIRGLDSGVIEEIKQRSLVFQDREVLYSTEYGDIINNVDDNGEVFVGDLYVCQHKSFKYSYNIKPKLLKLSQDRDAVSEWELQELTAQIIVATGDVEFIKQSILSGGRDTLSINNYSWENKRSTPTEVDDSFAEEFVKEHTGCLITNDYEEHERNIKLGNKSVYNPNKQVVNAIKKSDVYQQSLEDVEIVEQEPVKELIGKLLDKLDRLYEDRGYLNIADKSLIDEIRERLDNDDNLGF
jgi:hypothetical protein